MIAEALRSAKRAALAGDLRVILLILLQPDPAGRRCRWLEPRCPRPPVPVSCSAVSVNGVVPSALQPFRYW